LDRIVRFLLLLVYRPDQLLLAALAFWLRQLTLTRGQGPR
jgi:hypothetical protein